MTQWKKTAKTLRSILYENKEEKRIAYILMTDKHIFQNPANEKQTNQPTHPKNSSQKYPSKLF